MDRRSFLELLGVAMVAPFRVPAAAPAWTPAQRAVWRAQWDEYSKVARAFKVPPHLVVTTETIEVQAMGQRCYLPGRTYVYEQWPDP